MIKRIIFAALALCFTVSAWAADSAPYQEGEQYVRLERPVPTTTPGKIEVVEMFSYACPHCNHFEPLLHAWSEKMPKDVALVRIPVVFSRAWEPYARAFYVAKLLGKVKETHQAMFDAIHKERRRFTSAGDFADFYSHYGVKPEEFKRQYNSFAVNMMLKQGESKARGYEITGVPTMIVDGKYRVSADMAGSHEEMLKVVDYLIQKERASK